MATAMAWNFWCSERGGALANASHTQLCGFGWSCPTPAAQVAGDRVAGVRHRDILIARAVRGLCSVRGDDAVMVKRWPVHSFDHNAIKRAHSEQAQLAHS